MIRALTSELFHSVGTVYIDCFLSIDLSIDTASPSLLSIMRRNACVRIKSKKIIVRAKRLKSDSEE